MTEEHTLLRCPVCKKVTGYTLYVPAEGEELPEPVCIPCYPTYKTNNPEVEF